MRLIVVLALASFGLLSSSSEACTSFGLYKGGKKFVGKSYDWFDSRALLMTNHRGVDKSTFFMKAKYSGKILKWRSKYGSLTFNQYGREFPLGGMNEKGVVIEVLWFNGTKLPDSSDKRPALNELQWIQYNLDNFASKDEILKNAAKIRVQKVYANVHYMVCDPSGCASVEYIDKKLVVRTKATMPLVAVANNSYDHSLRYAKTLKPFGGSKSLPRWSLKSKDRFARAAYYAKQFDGTGDSVKYGFKALYSLRNRGFLTSMWQALYDIENLKVHFRVGRSSTVKAFALNQFDFSCKKPVLALDIDGSINGNRNKFSSYKTADNRKLLDGTLGTLGFEDEEIRKIADFADSLTSCSP